MKKLSGFVITFNEAAKVGTALASMVGVCDEILVVDSHSDDETPEICRHFACNVVQRPWPGYREQKQYATDLAAHDWVLSLDADECLSGPLREEILRWKTSEESSEEAYEIPRITYFMGRWIHHTIWYPDWQVRLFRKSAGKWSGGRVHESFKVGGGLGRLQEHLLHYTYASIAEYLEQLRKFTDLAAQDYMERGRRANWSHLALHPPAAFLRSYLVRAGFLDGVPGFCVSMLAAVSVFFKYCRLRELQIDGTGPPAPWQEGESRGTR